MLIKKKRFFGTSVSFYSLSIVEYRPTLSFIVFIPIPLISIAATPQQCLRVLMSFHECRIFPIPSSEFTILYKKKRKKEKKREKGPSFRSQRLRRGLSRETRHLVGLPCRSRERAGENYADAAMRSERIIVGSTRKYNIESRKLSKSSDPGPP